MVPAALFAVSEQVPPAISVTVFPETLQTPVELLLIVTLRPELAVALTVKLPSLRLLPVGSAVKLIVWVAAAVATERLTVVAALKVLPLPA